MASVKTTTAKTTKPAVEAPAKNLPAKPAKKVNTSAPTSGIAPEAPKAKPVAAPKVEKAPKAEKVAKAKPESDGTRGRKRDTELLGSKVVATEKKAKEGSFYADMQAKAKKPIVLETLIEAMTAEHSVEGEAYHQAPRAKVLDGLKRLGYIAAV